MDLCGHVSSPGAEISQFNMQIANKKFIFTLERQNSHSDSFIANFQKSRLKELGPLFLPSDQKAPA